MKYALVGALFATTASLATAADKGVEAQKCSEVYQNSSVVITKAPSKVLEHVATLVAANEQCAGDVVKAAITVTKADDKLVGQIVETAITSAPKQLSKIVAAAVATAPDAKTQIAAVVSNFGQGTAEGDEVNPLDSAGRGSVVVQNSNGGGSVQSQGGVSGSTKNVNSTPDGPTK